jgi:hypothetical protein
LLKNEEIDESITKGNDKSIVATKVGSLKYCFIHFDGSELVFTLHKVKNVTELLVNFVKYQLGVEKLT